MKKLSFIFLVLILLLVQCQENSQKMKSAQKNSFKEVTSKLNEGGEFYLYFSTEQIIKSLEEFVLNLRKTIEGIASKSQTKTMEELKIFDFIFNLTKTCGLTEISGIGMSSIAIEPELNHSKVVIHHYKGNGKGLIWHFMEENPHELRGLKLLPADTVFATFTDFKIKALWDWIKDEGKTSTIPQLQKGISSVEPELQKQGVALDKLLDSYADNMGLVITLDSKTNVSIPNLGRKTKFKIPEPAMAIVLSVKNDYLFNLLQQKLQLPLKTEENNIKTLEIPAPKLPIPITFEPVIVLRDNLMILASNNQIVESMFKTKEEGNGLTTTEEFKRLSRYMPDKGNGFRFLGSRLFKAVMDFQKFAMETKEGMTGDDAAVLTLLKQFQKEWILYSVAQNTDQGLVASVNHNLSFAYTMILPAIATTGIVAAIAVPNLLMASEKGKQNATIASMKNISLAIESYMIDKGHAPKGKSLTDIKVTLQPFYIKTLPLKDAWGNELLYTHGTGTRKGEFSIGSPGKDGVFHGWDQKGFYLVTKTKDFTRDIVMTNSSVIYGPQ